MNETIYGIWNTAAGHNSSSSSVGYSTGDYTSPQDSQKAFNGKNSTKYINFGICNSTYGGTITACGRNTGLYFSPRRGISLLLGFRFCTADNYPLRDPVLVTLEGSNQLATTLTLGYS